MRGAENVEDKMKVRQIPTAPVAWSGEHSTINNFVMVQNLLKQVPRT